jgi:two-component system, NtrC family, response regulator
MGGQRGKMDTILIVDDEKNYLVVLEDMLSDEGYQVVTADAGVKALEIAHSHDLDLVITDMKMPGMDGMALLERIHIFKADLPVIVMTAHGDVEKAEDAMRRGVFEYIFKPFNNEQLKLTVRRAVEHYRLICHNRELSQELQERHQYGNIIGKNKTMQSIYALIEKVAPSKATVLITGESGTGKELIARAIHYNSPRMNQPFISVNCGALPETLLESELFGHEKGAFSGAVNQRKGRFELAHEGTLFLDEVSEMSPHLQVKLLRILQEMEFERVGGITTLKVDVRIVAASNRDLREEVAQGRFRADLFYRLNVVHIHLPALRERNDDIPLLADYFLQKLHKESGSAPLSMESEALRCLVGYHWPGNIRELQNVMERAAILCDGESIRVCDLPVELREPIPSLQPPENMETVNAAARGEVDDDAGFGDAEADRHRPRTAQHQARAIDFVKRNGFITNKAYSALNKVSERQALRELSEMVEKEILLRVGKGRACRYVLFEDVPRI